MKSKCIVVIDTATQTEKMRTLASNLGKLRNSRDGNKPMVMGLNAGGFEVVDADVWQDRLDAASAKPEGYDIVSRLTARLSLHDGDNVVGKTHLEQDLASARAKYTAAAATVDSEELATRQRISATRADHSEAVARVLRGED